MKPRLKRYLATVGDLPTVPAVAAEVMQLVEDPGTSVDELRHAIERDPAIAARILKVSNSSLYGFSRQVDTLGHAISLLGFRTVRNLVLSASLKGSFKRFGLTQKLLWEHAMLAGATALKLAHYGPVDLEREEAFTIGLLHDLGKVAFDNCSPAEYAKVLAHVYNDGMAFVEAERALFGFDHAELGAEVAAKWKLSKRLEAAIRHHHEPESLARLPELDARYTALASVTTAVCTRLGAGRRAPVEEIDLARLPAWSFLGLEETDVEPILELATSQIKEAAALTT